MRQRPVEQIDDARALGCGRNGRSGPDHSPGAYLRVYRRLNRRCASGGATPCTDCPDSSEDSEGSTSADVVDVPVVMQRKVRNLLGSMQRPRKTNEVAFMLRAMK